MAGRTVSIAFLGDDASLRAAFIRSGLSAEDFAAKVQASSTKATEALARMGVVATETGAKIDASGKVAAEAAAKQEAAAAKQAKNADMVSSKMASLGKWALVGLGGAGLEAVRMAEKFQTSTASIQASAGISQKAAASLGNAFLDTAGKSTFSGAAMASAYAGVAGQLRLTQGQALSNAQALSVMHSATDLAEASQTDLGTATSALANVMQAYHLGVNGAAGASNILFNTAKVLAIPVSQVAQAVDRLHGRLGSLAPSLTDVSTLMTEMATHGVTGSRGVLMVNTALQTLVGQSKKTTEVLQAMGVNVFDSSGHFIGLQSAIQQLGPKFAQMTQQQQLFAAQTIFGKGAAQAMLQVIQSGVPAYQTATAAVTKHNAVSSAAAAQQHTLAGEVKTLEATVVDLGTKFGLFLIPKLQAVGAAVQSVIGWFEKHRAAATALAAVITGVLGTAVATFAYQKAASFVGAVKDMASGIGGLTKSIGGAVPAMLRSLGLIGPAATTAKVEMGAAEAGMVGETEGAAAGIDAAIGSTGVGLVIVGVGLAVTELATHWTQAMNSIKSITQTAINFAIRLLNDLIGVFNSTIGQILGDIGKVGNVNFSGSGKSPSIPWNSTGGGGAPLGSGIHPTRGPGGAVRLPASGSNWQKIAGALAGQGFSSVAIAGILGNFAQETGGGSLGSINTRDSGSGASGMGGMGIAQWTAGRRQAEMAYAASHHESATSLAAQVGYLVQELRTNYHKAFTGIQHAGNPKAAAAIFNQLFEGGTDPGSIREREAAQAYALLTAGYRAGGGGSATTGGGNSAIAKLLRATSSGSAGKAVKSLLYANPLAGDQYNVERTDQGKDFGDIHGSLKAIGTGIITLAQNLPGFGQTIVERLTSGPNKGREIYYGLETGATGVGLHAGERVRAGQAVAQGRGTGGVELGFWNPATGHAWGNQGFTGSNATPGGQAFADFLRQIGNRGLFTSTKGGVTTGGGSNIGYTLAQLEQAYTKALLNAGNALLNKLNNAIQNGTVKTLTNLLGVGTGGKTAARLRSTIEGIDTGTVLSQLNAGKEPLAIDSMTGPKNMTGFTRELSAQVGKVHGAALAQLDRLLGEKHGTALDRLVAALTALHGKALTRIESRLHDSHSKPMRELGKDLSKGPGTLASLTSILSRSEAKSPQGRAFDSQIASLISAGQIKMAERLVAAHKAAMATLVQEIYAEQIVKDAESLKIQATQLQDQTRLMQNTDADLLNIQKAQAQQQSDKMNEQVTAVKDATQTMTDLLAGAVQALQDSAQRMSDASSAIVTGINDNVQIQVDTFGERGLYGLNLVAQKLTVQYDVLKAGFDQQIAKAQQNLDAVTSQGHVAEQQAHLQVDQVQSSQDSLVALAQQRADLVNVRAAIAIAAAQARVDNTTLHEDVSVVGPAQTAVDMGATLPKAQQDVLNAILSKAQGTANVAINAATRNLAAVTDQQNQLMQTAAAALQGAQDSAALAEANSQATLASVTGQTNIAIQQATDTLQQIQDNAAQQEAMAQGGIAVTQAQASTQFAGSGLVVNIYGIPTENAAAIGTAMDWFARQNLGLGS